MHRVAAQQARALDDVVVRALAHDDGAQAQALAATGVFDQDAGQQPPDAAEAVQHNVGARALVEAMLADNRAEFFSQVGIEGDVGGARPVPHGETGQVERGSAQIQVAEGLQDGQSLVE